MQVSAVQNIYFCCFIIGALWYGIMRADKPDSVAVLGELRTGRPGITVTVGMSRLELLSNVTKFYIVLLSESTT